MTAIQVIENPTLEGTRRAFVLAEDRVGHYPEFREFFVRQFSLDVTRALASRLRTGAFGNDLRARLHRS